MEGQRCSEQGGAGGEIAEGPEEMFGGDGYVCYLVCGDGFMGAPVCQDLSEGTLYTCVVYCLSIKPQ